MIYESGWGSLPCQLEEVARVSLRGWLPLDPTQISKSTSSAPECPSPPWTEAGGRQESSRQLSAAFSYPTHGSSWLVSLSASPEHLSRCLVGHYWSMRNKIQWTRLQSGISSTHQHPNHIYFLSESPLHTSWVNFLLILLKYTLHVVQFD